MYIFERQKGESIVAYKAFIEYREGNCNPSGNSYRRQKQIEQWMEKWGWEERKDLYEKFIDKQIQKRTNIESENSGGGDELQALLIELRKMLVMRIDNSKEEVESLSISNLSKLVSLSCRAIMDISKAERDLDMDKLDDHSWAELADIIRSDPDTFKLAQQLNRKVYGAN